MYSDSVFTCQRWLPVVVEKIKSEKLCQSFLGFGIVLIAIIVISFRSTEQMLWMRMTPATVVSILGLVLYGVYQSMTLFKNMNELYANRKEE